MLISENELNVHGERRRGMKSHPHVVFHGEEDVEVLIIMLQQLFGRLRALMGQMVCVHESRGKDRIQYKSLRLEHDSSCQYN